MTKESFVAFNEFVEGPAHYSTEAGSIKVRINPDSLNGKKEAKPDDSKSMDEILREDPAAWNHLDNYLGEKV